MSNRKRPTENPSIVLVPLDKLKKSPGNVRKIPHAKSEIEALAASIAAIGMLQYPVVEPERREDGKPTGCYLVTAGEGRRLAQLLRVKRKEIKKTEPIPCLLDTTHNATEISLAENAIRATMHPADEYEAFSELHNQHGMSADDIAARFGVTAAVVKQRLKLAAVSPKLLALYREGEMNLEQLTAFAITDDHARQEQVWDDLGYDTSRRAILRALTEGQVASDDRRVAFVGLEAYEAAGGTVIRDLFAAEGGYLSDAALLNRLVREKLQRLAEPVLAEGWKWVAVEPEFDYRQTAGMTRLDTVPKARTAEEQEQLDALEQRLDILISETEFHPRSGPLHAEIDALEAQIEAMIQPLYEPGDIARAGAFVALGHDGEVRIERGYVRPEDRPHDGEARDDASTEGGKGAGGPAGLSAALVAELTAHRTAVLCNDLALAPELALIAVAHALAAQTFYGPCHGLSCLEITARQISLTASAPGIDEGLAGQAIAERHQAWAARMPEDGSALWPFVSGLSMDELLALLAHCAALSLDAVQRPGGRREEALAHAGKLAHAMPHQMARFWQPTVANYLGRVSKELVLDAVREGAGDDAARRIGGLKKQAMAQRAEELLAGKGWLPPVLATVAADRAAV